MAWSVPCYDKIFDNYNYQPRLHSPFAACGACEPGLADPGMARGGPEQLSHRDWYEAPARPVPAPLLRQVWCYATVCHGLGGCPTISPDTHGTDARLQRDGSVTLDIFNGQVDELSRFYH